MKRNMSRLILIAASQLMFAGIACGDLVVDVFENTTDETVDFSYSGILDVDGLGTPTSGSFVPYIFSPGGAGDGDVTFGNSPLSDDLDIYEMANLVPISGTTMGATLTVNLPSIEKVCCSVLSTAAVSSTPS